MTLKIIFGLMLPFAGTLCGCGCVLFMKDCMSDRVRSALLGFAGGIMVAASVWSLIIPAMEYSRSLGKLAFIPAAIGFLLGGGFLMLIEHFAPHAEEGGAGLTRTAKLLLAVGLHNIPEGMAVGAVFAGLLSGYTGIAFAGAVGLSAGIAIQNVPEGAIVSMPLKAEGKSKGGAFLAGFISGIVEPIGAFVTLLAVAHILPVLPYLLGFAAGAMIYVVVNDLVPEMAVSSYEKLGASMFAVGFTVMMTLDVMLG